jgi:hypothetical protein
MRLAAVMAVLAIHAAAVAEAQEPDEGRIFTFIKGTPAKELDSALPKMRFERWLLDVVGKGVELRWSINDCGEQSGDREADARRDMPVCAGVEAQLDGGRAFQILLTIGTQKKGIGGKPKLRSIIVQANRRMWDVKRLRDLPKALAPQPSQ